jgi:hypothetical protein
MKRLVYILALIGLAALARPLEVLAAPDTLTVVATPAGNINSVINGDTLAGGVRAHPDRYYRLRRGSVYQVTERMNINGSLNIIANDSAGIRPPVLAPAILSDNSSIDHFFEFTGKAGKVSMSNIYLLSQRADNNWLGWSDGIRVLADSVKLKLRGVIFEGFSNSGINGSYWTKLDVQDCEFRNHQHSSAWFGGQPFMTGGTVCLDTIKFINNTFLANNSYSFSIRGYTPYAAFEHNTMVFGTVNPFLIRQANHLRIRNNIFYAMHAMGGNPDHVINGWFLNYPDTASSSIIRIRGNDSVSYYSKTVWGAIMTGPEVYVDATHGVTPAMVDPTKRYFDVRNNVFFLPTKLTNFYKAYNDTVKTKDSVDVPIGGGKTQKQYLTRYLKTPTWISDYALWTIDSLAGKLSPNVKRPANDRIVDPGFPAVVTNHLDSLIAYIHKITTGKLDIRWAYPTNTLYPPTWPLPENMTYTNSTLLNAGSDGFAVGDLNWFPTQKAAWLLTGVELVNNQLPEGYSLSQNYPNPFNPATKIQFSVPRQSNVELKVYNMLGQEVATLIATTMAPGTYSVDFDASKLASGAYVYRLKAGEFISSNKMLLMK